MILELIVGQVSSTRSDGHGNMRLCRIIVDSHKNEATVLMKICTIFYSFVHSDLALRPLDLKFARLLSLVRRYVITKSDVSTAFLFRENRRYGTD